jgi:hypothetical protein
VLRWVVLRHLAYSLYLVLQVLLWVCLHLPYSFLCEYDLTHAISSFNLNSLISNFTYHLFMSSPLCRINWRLRMMCRMSKHLHRGAIGECYFMLMFILHAWYLWWWTCGLVMNLCLLGDELVVLWLLCDICVMYVWYMCGICDMLSYMYGMVSYMVVYVIYILFDWLEWKKQKKDVFGHFAECHCQHTR